MTAPTESAPKVPPRASLSNSASLVCGGIALVAFTVAIFAAVRNAYRGYASLSWPTTEAVITYLNPGNVFEERQGDHTRIFHGNQLVRYTFEVQEVRYEGKRVDFEDYDLKDTIFAPALARLNRRYPVGTRAAVSYNPSNPSDSALVPGQTWWKAVTKLGILCFFMAATCLGVALCLFVQMGKCPAPDPQRQQL